MAFPFFPLSIWSGTDEGIFNAGATFGARMVGGVVGIKLFRSRGFPPLAPFETAVILFPLVFSKAVEVADEGRIAVGAWTGLWSFEFSSLLECAGDDVKGPNLSCALPEDITEPSDGASDGASLRRKDGTSLGTMEGSSDGNEEGSSEGRNDGDKVKSWYCGGGGPSNGLNEGFSEGKLDGTSEGTREGKSLGMIIVWSKSAKISISDVFIGNTDFVGTREGITDGPSDGMGDFFWVWNDDGKSEGDRDGTSLIAMDDPTCSFDDGVAEGRVDGISEGSKEGISLEIKEDG